MKKQVTQKKCFNKKPGFTLVETAIAMGMVAVMISSFMVVFGPALEGIDKSLSAKEADRLTNALELELNVLRNGETYGTTFDKSFWWIKQSPQNSKNPVLIYQYRGNPASLVSGHPDYRGDGTMAPFTYNATNPGIPGVNYVIQTSVRRLNDAVDSSIIQAELAPGVLEGKVYYAKLLQLSKGADPLAEDKMETHENPSDVYNPQATTVTVDFTQYTEAVLAFRAEFYEVKPALYSYINNTWSVANVGNPVITKNMAVMR